MAREEEMLLMAYKHKVQESHLPIEKYQKDVKDKDAILTKNKAKILKLEGDLLNKFEKLRKRTSIVLSRDREQVVLNRWPRRLKIL